jgi:DnaJ-class molecular chaperone
MIFMEVECRCCNGLGKTHSFNRGGDPMDPGVTCAKCEGTGVVTEDIDQSDETDDE